MGVTSLYRTLAVLTLMHAALLAPGRAPAAAGGESGAMGVSPQGRLVPAGDAMTRVSPDGDWELRVSPTGAGEGTFTCDLTVRHLVTGAAERRLTGVQGQVFFMSALPAVIALDGPESNSLPGSLRVLDLDGRLVHQRSVRAIRDPQMSPDGMTFGCLSDEGLLLLDLRTMNERTLPVTAPYALGPAGGVAWFAEEASAIRIETDDAGSIQRPWDEAVRELAFAPNGSALYVLGGMSVQRVDLSTGVARALFRATATERARDLSVRGDRVHVGVSRTADGSMQGIALVFDGDGSPLARTASPARQIPRADTDGLVSERGIPWPILPNAQHPVGNTYGEYQNYGGAPYPHPGFDVMGSPGQPVFAVRRGQVKAVLTTSGPWHWRVAVGDSAMAATQRGYLYAHLEESSIAVDVGDVVQQGQYLGDLVEWPGWNFTHCHFTRIEDSGNTWDGVWLSVHNPHLDITQQSETEAPVFEPARNNDLLAFCRNQTSTYLAPNQLNGSVDIIAHVGDRIASEWVCTVSELRYTIYPLGMPAYPIVNNKLAQNFDMTCDTYGSGQLDAMLINIIYKDDTTCNTQGDYDFREFYHVLTNSDGDGVYEQSDLNEAWNTTLLPDREWVIKVVATDVRGNVKQDSMVVRTVNGNPSAAFDLGPATRVLELGALVPNPMEERGQALLVVPEPGHVVAAVYDPLGRRIRVLADRMIASGTWPLAWDGRDDSGKDVPSGSYILRVSADRQGERSTRFVLVR